MVKKASFYTLEDAKAWIGNSIAKIEECATTRHGIESVYYKVTVSV